MNQKYEKVGLLFAIAACLLLRCAPSRSQSFEYEHGTCVIAVWTANQAVVGADTLSIKGKSDVSGHTLDTPLDKLHAYENGLAASIVGLSAAGIKDATLWDGLAEADTILSGLPKNPTDSQVVNAIGKWRTTLVDAESRKKFTVPLPPRPGQELVSLQVYARTSDQGLGVYLGRFYNEGGSLKFGIIRLFDVSKQEPIRFQPFGKCRDYLDRAASRSNLLPSELARYTELNNDVLHSRDIQSTDRLVTKLERLAAEINARLATNDVPQDIAPPFDIYTLASGTDSWEHTRVQR